MMYKNISMTILCTMILIFNIQAKRYTLDKTVAVIYHREGEALIVHSDLVKGVDMGARTIDDLVFEKLMLFDAQALKIETDEESRDKALKQVQKMHDLTEDEVKDLFKGMGLAWDDGLQMLSDKQIIENVIDYRVKRDVKVDENDAAEYDAAHPLTIYTVSFAWIPIGNRSKTLLKIKLDRQLASGIFDETLSWGTQIEVKGDTIADEKSFIKELKPGEVAISTETDDGIQLVRLEKSEPVTLDDERKREIMGRLGQERFIEAMKRYHETLLERAFVKYL